MCLGSLSCWNVHSHLIFIILVDGSRFFSRTSRYIFPFILSFNYMNFASATPWCFGVMCSAVPPNMVYIMASKYTVQFFVSSDQTIFCQYFTGLSKCCAANFKRASTYFFFSNRALHGERAYRPRRLSALLIVFFETILHANSRSFWSSPQVILGSWTTLLIIIFTPLSENLRGAPGRGRFMVKLCSFHFWIMAPTVLTGTFRSIEILL